MKHSAQKVSSKVTNWEWVLAGVAVILYLLLAFIRYPVIGHDGALQLNWIYQFTNQVHEGNWYPRWMHDSFGGFGSPTFYFYPPLPYFIGSLASLVYGFRADAHDLYHIVHIAGTALCFWTSSTFFRKLTPKISRASFAALLYTFAPYRMLDIFVRNALGESIAFAWLPVLLLGLYYLSQDSGTYSSSFYKGVLITSLSVALLLITSIPVAVIGSLLGVLYLISSERKLRLTIGAVLGSVLGLGLAMFYLLPLLEYYPLVHTEYLWSIFDWKGKGFALLSLLGGHEPSSIIINLFTLLLSVLIVIRWVRSRKEASISSSWLLLFAILSFIVQLPWLASLLWENPLFKAIQLPFRWNLVISFLLGACYVLYQDRWIRAFAVTAIVVSIGLLGFSLQKEVRRTASKSEVYREAPEYLPKTVPLTPEEASSLSEEWGSPVLKNKLTKNQSLLSVPVSDSLIVGADALITFRSFYWPTLRVRANTKLLEPHSDSLGLLQVQLTKGIYDPELVTIRSAQEKAGLIITLISVLLYILISFWMRTVKRRYKESISTGAVSVS